MKNNLQLLAMIAHRSHRISRCLMEQMQGVPFPYESDFTGNTYVLHCSQKLLNRSSRLANFIF